MNKRKGEAMRDKLRRFYILHVKRPRVSRVGNRLDTYVTSQWESL